MADLHICGNCKFAFYDIDSFVKHKKSSCTKLLPASNNYLSDIEVDNVEPFDDSLSSMNGDPLTDLCNLSSNIELM